MYRTTFKHKFKINDIVYFRDFSNKCVYQGVVRYLQYFETEEGGKALYTIDYDKYEKGELKKAYWNYDDDVVFSTREEVELNVKI